MLWGALLFPVQISSPGWPMAVSFSPLQLASFAVQKFSSNSMQPKWTTVSETNNYGFYVQIGSGSLFLQIVVFVRLRYLWTHATVREAPHEPDSIVQPECRTGVRLRTHSLAPVTTNLGPAGDNQRVGPGFPDVSVLRS